MISGRKFCIFIIIIIIIKIRVPFINTMVLLPIHHHCIKLLSNERSQDKSFCFASKWIFLLRLGSEVCPYGNKTSFRWMTLQFQKLFHNNLLLVIIKNNNIIVHENTSNPCFILQNLVLWIRRTWKVSDFWNLIVFSIWQNLQEASYLCRICCKSYKCKPTFRILAFQ